MALEPQKIPDNSDSPKAEENKNEDSLATLDMEDFDATANEDDLALPTENDLANKKLAVRRKIEMYWEKKRLQEQLGDFGEIDFDF